MKKYLFFIMFFVVSTFSNGQQTPEELTIQFFTTFETQGSSEALDELYATNQWMSRSADAISNVKSQLNGLNEEYVGKYYGYEKIMEKSLGNSYVLISYLVKYDRQPIRFTFQYYKPQNDWVVYGFKFDGNIDAEIEAAANLQYLDY